ncbi:prolyl oligopeptidase family serine peptidase [Undibacterium sp. RTI2.1]|uniref:S9 family peptidase n=1 Tax=unclassified Undibacterium TaxID=2630295 RepID=UPI002B232CCD|nr:MULTISPECIES: alpha/beta fold hydrolase [unclassified Undibacterium]MEB0030612.1 prolyl oligopeptidase family serine peptidase [Undibacterium sp. RTI2.1]MEB0116552.1 prolyl oligopeptidase family serine peptidase [Undibacterium sp. RTI2.2]
MISNFIGRSKLIFTIAIIGVILFSTASNSRASAEQTSVDIFFENPKLDKAALSPDGKYLGVLVATKSGRMQLAVVDLATKSSKIISGFSNADIDEFHWVNDDRLVFSTKDKNVGIGDNRFFPGLYAINRDGSGARTLVDRVWGEEFTTGTIIKSRILRADNYFYSVDFSKGSNSVFVVHPVWDAVYDLKALSLIRLDTTTGAVERITRPGDSKEWLIDQFGTPRINITTNEGVSTIYYLDPKTEKWRQLSQFNTFKEGSFTPFFFGPDGSLYVTARNGHDTSALYRFDLEKNAIDPNPLVSITGYDFDGSMIFDFSKKKLLGVRYENDASSTIWFDEEMKKIQTSIDTLLPNTINDLSISRNGVSQNVLIRSYSDVQPATFLIYDITTKKLDLIGGKHPDIESKKMAAQDMVRYKAKDGLEIPAYLTLPQGKANKNLPMVVLVHGGPFVRGVNWGWDPEVQFLASKGYAVLQPEFRGSTGYGYKHFRAGWKQWGLAMQDDIADGTKWAIQQGIADPKRICIAGASYGGYAVLMGLAKNPELFRCGVNWVGVTDLNLMYQSNWNSDADAQWQNYGMPVLIGDKVKDAAQLKETSPVEIADRIRQPLLLAYGGSDRRVPIAHGKDFLAAVRKTNSSVEWIEYVEEGHGWGLVKNRLDFWNKVDHFLDANIGK